MSSKFWMHLRYLVVFKFECTKDERSCVSFIHALNDQILLSVDYI